MPSPRSLTGRLVGYARSSTSDQEVSGQEQSLQGAGCTVIFSDVTSGLKSRRPQLDRCLDDLTEGDTLVINRFDRLGRSVSHLQKVLKELNDRGIVLRSLHENVDTSTAAGQTVIRLLPIFADFEAGLAQERTRHGVRAAKERGAQFGNPRFRNRDTDAINEMKASQAATYLERARTRSRPWIHHVEQLRPDRSWRLVHSHIAGQLPADQVPSLETMVSTVHRLVHAGDLPREILHRAPNAPGDGAREAAQRLARENPAMSLREIGRELDGLGIRPARGKSWSPMGISRLLAED